ncbi:uncharacterized protein LOC117293947 [Asterias rubens]|nr:uncharacterized protein LOC117293947 [Asterias rubens]
MKTKNTYVTLRACKDRLRHLQNAHRRNEMSSLRASGTDEEYDERSQLLTELADLDEERKHEDAKKKSEEEEKEKQGLAIRAAAMESLVPAKKAPDGDKKGYFLT